MLLELNNKNYKVDFQSKQLTFLDQRYYTTPEGGFVPSVTTILEAYPKTSISVGIILGYFVCKYWLKDDAKEWWANPRNN